MSFYCVQHNSRILSQRSTLLTYTLDGELESSRLAKGIGGERAETALTGPSRGHLMTQGHLMNVRSSDYHSHIQILKTALWLNNFEHLLLGPRFLLQLLLVFVLSWLLSSTTLSAGSMLLPKLARADALSDHKFKPNLNAKDLVVSDGHSTSCWVAILYLPIS